MNNNQKLNKTKKKKNVNVVRINRASNRDNALILRAEYSGQPTATLKMKGVPTVLTTTVTVGTVITNVALQSTAIFNFATRFSCFTEYRIVKVRANSRNFSSSNPGIANMWFSEDDSSAPNSSKALDAKCIQYNFSDVVNTYELDYVPHDPAQQTWTLVSAGTPIIGYFKLYTDSSVFGSPQTVVNLGIMTYEYTVQFRGLL